MKLYRLSDTQHDLSLVVYANDLEQAYTKADEELEKVSFGYDIYFDCWEELKED